MSTWSPPLNDGGTWNTILRSSSSEFPFELVLVDLSFNLIWYCLRFLLNFGIPFQLDLVLLEVPFEI